MVLGWVNLSESFPLVFLNYFLKAMFPNLIDLISAITIQFTLNISSFLSEYVLRSLLASQKCILLYFKVYLIYSLRFSYVCIMYFNHIHPISPRNTLSPNLCSSHIIFFLLLNIYIPQYSISTTFVK